MSQLTTRDYKGAARGARRARGASRARRSGNTGGLHQFLWGGIAGAILRLWTRLRPA
jgi:hypothetical protein